ncbi:MAG: hypothetical protein U9Q58_00105 [Pseudomonadota bacterium]|nr:hypothetical protein [Pseudomonadota bacterium]
MSEARAGQSWFVQSEYRSLMTGQLTTVLWQFEQHSLEGGGLMWGVHDRENNVRCRAELFFVSEGVLEQADCYREVCGQEICDARRYNVKDPVIMNQTLIPGDWLNGVSPFVLNDEIRQCVVRVLVGTTTFATHLKIRQKIISYDEAVMGGMIRVDLQAHFEKKNNLRLVSVVRLNGALEELEFVQLWAEGADFWLFESKKGRRSWCLVKE